MCHDIDMTALRHSQSRWHQLSFPHPSSSMIASVPVARAKREIMDAMQRCVAIITIHDHMYAISSLPQRAKDPIWRVAHDLVVLQMSLLDGRWSRHPVTAALTYPPNGTVCIAMGHRIMFCGGRIQQRHANYPKSTSRVQCIDVSPKPLSTKWLPLQSMNQSRYGASGAVSIDDNKLYIFGGNDEYHNALTSVEAYDAATNTWTMIDTRMPRTRTGHKLWWSIINNIHHIIILCLVKMRRPMITTYATEEVVTEVIVLVAIRVKIVIIMYVVYGYLVVC